MGGTDCFCWLIGASSCQRFGLRGQFLLRSESSAARGLSFGVGNDIVERLHEGMTQSATFPATRAVAYEIGAVTRIPKLGAEPALSVTPFHCLSARLLRRKANEQLLRVAVDTPFLHQPYIANFAQMPEGAARVEARERRRPRTRIGNHTATAVGEFHCGQRATLSAAVDAIV